MTNKERAIKIITKLADDVAPQVEDWVDRADAVWAEVMAEYRNRLIELHEEVKEVVGDDHLKAFGAIIAVTQPHAGIVGLLLEYETAGITLLKKMNDLMGDKKENDERRMRTVDSIVHTSESETA